jgi:hypothetical protein
MKKIIQVLLLGVFLTVSLVGCSSSQAATDNKKLSDVENDSYILYTLSYNEALQLNGASSSTIKVNKSDAQNTYTYTEHVLSCGTHMNGEIKEDLKDNIKTITGSFNVTKNSYGITDLKVNDTVDMSSNKKTGYLEVNGKQVDINSNFTSI